MLLEMLIFEARVCYYLLWSSQSDVSLIRKMKPPRHCVKCVLQSDSVMLFSYSVFTFQPSASLQPVPSLEHVKETKCFHFTLRLTLALVYLVNHWVWWGWSGRWWCWQWPGSVAALWWHSDWLELTLWCCSVWGWQRTEDRTGGGAASSAVSGVAWSGVRTLPTTLRVLWLHTAS